MRSGSDEYTTAFVRFSRHSVGLLHSPISLGPAASVGLIVSHPNSDYLNHISGAELASRGFRVLCVNGRYVNTRREHLIWEHVPLDIQPAVAYLRKLTGVRVVILVGHSGGGQLMPFYQNLAENGARAAQQPGRFAQGGAALSGLPPADGLVLLDPHHGYGANTLTSLDPAVRDEANPAAVDPALDIFDPANGYDPLRPNYSQDFLARYFRAQAERMTRLNGRAWERAQAIAAGKGVYHDDEPFVVARGQARVWQLDTRLVSETRGTYPILTADGQTVQDRARSVRVSGVTPGSSGAAGLTAAQNASYHGGTVVYSVKSWLSGNAISVDPERYQVTRDNIVGIDWDSSNTSTPANIANIRAPLLIMGMTGHYWMVPSEIFFNAAASQDKQLVFVEGASHNLVPCRACETSPGQYGDTVNTIFDYVAGWLQARFL